MAEDSPKAAEQPTAAEPTTNEEADGGKLKEIEILKSERSKFLIFDDLTGD